MKSLNIRVLKKEIINKMEVIIFSNLNSRDNDIKIMLLSQTKTL